MADPVTTTVFLGLIADRIIDALLSAGSKKVVEEAWGKLKGDEAKNAFKLALGEAIEGYANTTSELESEKITRWVVASPLFKENGFLTEKVVVEELAHILHFDREPNYQLIGERWKASMERPALQRRIDFTREARNFVSCLQIELQASEVFGPVFYSKSLNAINLNVSRAVEALANLEEKLVRLNETLNAQLMVLMEIWARTNPSIQDQIRDFTGNIQEWTDGFVGREFVFEKIKQFVRDNPRGYFLIKGEPGIGKTALMAEWVKTQGSIHHFNSRSDHFNQTNTFLRNICAQLIATYDLDHDFLPPETAQDSGFLIRLLHEISQQFKPEESVVIAIDALDEVDEVGPANLLYLPKILPKGVYVVATARPQDHPLLNIECEYEEWLIDQNSDDNLRDIRKFVEKWTEYEGVQAYINAQDMDPEEFVDYMTKEKSQGNFMYLRYVLRDIGRGVYKDKNLSELPKGLENYYQDHWHRMKIQSDDLWFKYKIPVLVALSLVKEPATLERIMRYSGVQDRLRVISVLKEWREFLYEPPGRKRYSLYHDSFRRFIAQQEEIDLVNALARIVEEDSEELSDYE